MDTLSATQAQIPSEIRIGFAQTIGNRATQQDSAGITDNGAFAVVADGMGGLSDGDIASDAVVKYALEFAQAIPASSQISDLLQGVRYIGASLNHTLEESGILRSGTTMICTRIVNRKLLWASVGDSRIYLMRNGGLIQLNREHNLLSRRLLQVARGELAANRMGPQADLAKLTSFFGMGTPALIDFPAEPLTLCPGDWVILMSDGVYHFLTEDEILEAFGQAEPQQACSNLLLKIDEKAHPTQDNATIIIQAV